MIPTSATDLSAHLVEAFRSNGFVVVPDLLSDAELDAFGPAVDEGVARRSRRDTRALSEKSRYEQSFIQCQNLWEDCPGVRPLTFHPAVTETAARLLGVPAIRLWHDQALYKEPGGRETDPHQDQPYWPIAEADTITAWIPIDGSTLDSGAMGYLPGSHLLGLRKFVNIFSGHPEDVLASQPLRDSAPVFVEVPRRSVAFHHGLTFHLARPNRTEQVRRVHTAIYFRDGCRRGSEFPHPSVDRAGIGVGAVIASDVTPVAWPRTPGDPPEAPGDYPDRGRRFGGVKTVVGPLSDDQRASWSERGFFRIEGFAAQSTCTAMLERVTAIVRHDGLAASVGAKITPENNKAGVEVEYPEDAVSKIFRLHRDDVFSAFATSPPVVDLVAELIAPDIDVFLSQFIFKTAGAWGQPWHQDSFYFPFTPARPVVGVWLAVTAATLENGCLHVLPGSSSESVHQHVPDRRPGANHGYYEIVDHDMSARQPVLMDPGDLLVFDSHLMHCSTDNASDGIRAAMVYHYAAAGTVDRSDEFFPSLNDWMPARRAIR